MSPLWLAIIGVSGTQVLQFPTNTTMCGVTLPTSHGNSSPNKVTLVLINLFSMMQCLFANHSNLSIVFDFSQGVVSHESSGINKLILVFNTLHWPVEKIHQVMRHSLLDYGRLECHATLRIPPTRVGRVDHTANTDTQNLPLP